MQERLECARLVIRLDPASQTDGAFGLAGKHFDRRIDPTELPQGGCRHPAGNQFPTDRPTAEQIAGVSASPAITARCQTCGVFEQPRSGAGFETAAGGSIAPAAPALEETAQCGRAGSDSPGDLRLRDSLLEQREGGLDNPDVLVGQSALECSEGGLGPNGFGLV